MVSLLFSSKSSFVKLFCRGTRTKSLRAFSYGNVWNWRICDRAKKMTLVFLFPWKKTRWRQWYVLKTTCKKNLREILNWRIELNSFDSLECDQASARQPDKRNTKLRFSPSTWVLHLNNISVTCISVSKNQNPHLLVYLLTFLGQCIARYRVQHTESSMCNLLMHICPHDESDQNLLLINAFLNTTYFWQKKQIVISYCFDTMLTDTCQLTFCLC